MSPARIHYPSGSTPDMAYFLDAVWPNPANAFDYVAPAAITTQAMSRVSTGTMNVYSQVVAGGARMRDYRERIGMQLVSGVDGAVISNALRFHPMLTSTLITDSRFRHSETARVFRIEHELAIIAGAPAAAAGVCWVSGTRNGLGSTYPTAVGNGGGFGLQGNGAGGWQFFSKITVAGGFVQQIPIVWPVPVSEVALVVWEVISAYANNPARLRMWVNGIKFIDQLWTNGLLPTYDLGGGNIAVGFAFGASISGAGGTIFVGNTRWLAGRFTAEGTEARSAIQGSI